MTVQHVFSDIHFNDVQLRNVSFPHEAIRGSDFFSAQVDAFPYHEWPKATSDREMHQQVLRKSQTRILPHVEKAFSNVAINKLKNPLKIEKFSL